jgi:hypothetical protein
MRIFFSNIIGAVILFTLVSSCSEDSTPEVNNIFLITVASIGGDCALLLIDFNEEDKSRIEELTQTSNELRFYAFNLSKEYNQPGKNLKIRVRKTADDELYACTHRGVTYPWVTVLSVED